MESDTRNGPRKVESEEDSRNRAYTTFQKKFSEKFQTLNIATDYFFSTGLESDDSDIRKAASKFAPDAILLIDFTSGAVNDYDIMIIARFDLAFFDYKSGKCFWKAKMTMSPNTENPGYAYSPEDISRVIFNDLIEYSKSKDGSSWF